MDDAQGSSGWEWTFRREQDDELCGAAGPRRNAGEFTSSKPDVKMYLGADWSASLRRNRCQLPYG